MPLLSPTQIAEFRAAIGQVTDQFFTTQIIYRKMKPGLDRYQEDHADRTYSQYVFNAMVTPVITERTETTIEPLGGRVSNEIIVTVNMRTLLALGDNLIDATTFEPHMDPAVDILYLEDDGSIPYKVQRVTKHGPIDKEDVLVKIKCKREEQVAARIA